MPVARKKKPVERAQLITNNIYDHAKSMGLNVTSMYAMTFKRIRELVEETGDPDQVELVALRMLEHEGRNFVAWRSLSWGTYEYFKNQMEIPEGGWKYALAGYEAEDDINDSVDYWLREWRDAELDGDDVRAWKVREKLEKLMKTIEVRKAMKAE